jgi:heptosyltransferase-2
MGICEAIAAGVRESLRGRVMVLGRVNGGKGVSVGGLKEVVRGARVMVCNDTGPRHMAAALGVPVVTIFGPTDPAWAETYFEGERIVRAEPFPACGPCQLKVCPIDHRCMAGVTVESVMKAVGEVWR